MAAEKVDVVVVGGGLAGLSTARELTRGGARVVVLEARERVGGRTLSREHDGRVVDLGGQWLGPTQDRALRLADELGLHRFPTWHEGRKVLERRSGVSSYASAIPSLPLLSLGQLHLAIKAVDKLMEKVPLDDPTAARRAAEWDGETLESWKQRYLRGEAVREVLDAAVRTIFGAEPAEISFLHFLFYLRSGGGLLRLAEVREGAQEWRLAEGAQTLSTRLADQLGDAVVLSAPARTVRQEDGHVTVETDRGAFRGDFAVVAMAPALAGRLVYHPALPPDRDALTQRMPMGATIKCIACYREPFWRSRGFSGEAVSSQGPISITYDNSAHDGPPYALVAFVVGAHARRLSLRPPEERRGAVLRHLTGLFGADAAEPTAFLEQDWSREEWTRGCPVAFLPPGGWTTAGAALRRPVGRIHWAGTETARVWAGYLEGALESGERAAREILDRMPHR